MTKIGRNDPCPCGSGKKYKKCCLTKDQEEARLQAKDQEEARLQAREAAEVLPRSGAGFGDLFPPIGVPEMLAEIEAINQRWAASEAASREEQMEMFRERLASGELDEEEAFEALAELRDTAEGREEREAFVRFLLEYRDLAPEMYHSDFGLYSLWLIEEALEQGQIERLPDLLEPFAQEPVPFVDEFHEVIHLLMYHGQLAPLLPVMRRAWPAISRSEELLDWFIDQYRQELRSLIVFEYLDSTTTPRPEDPALQEALSAIGEHDPRMIRLHVLSLLGQVPQPLRLADFSPQIDQEALETNISRFSLEWLGELRRIHGIALTKGELARELLTVYLNQRAEDSARGGALFLPGWQLLEYLRERFLGTIDGGYLVGSVLELLPFYHDYLLRHDLMNASEADHAWDELRGMTDSLLHVMKKYEEEPVVVRAVEKVNASYQPSTEVYGEHGLLAQLRAAGEEPDRTLLDQVKAQGSGVVPALVAMATDETLLGDIEDRPERWAPQHAIQILGEMGAAEAVEPLLSLCSWDDDWLEATLAEFFGSIGLPALDPLRALLLDRSEGVYARSRAGQGLVEIARRHPELRDQVVAALVACLEPAKPRTPDDETLNGFIIGHLCHVEAVEAIPAIERAFKEDRVDRFIIRLSDVRAQLGVPGKR